uniref:B-cell receptor CD22 n=1 Tax=Chelonoidis abingdonii TaxID=106734 RepID=A0A8C0JHG4_CHEAB
LHLPACPSLPSVTLLLLGFLCQCDPPVEVPESLSAWTGACLSIWCRYKSCVVNPIKTNKLIISSLTWYLNPVYDFEKKHFSGTILYKHNVTISPALARRVRFLGDLEKDCSLQLSDLRASENGSYGLRLIALNPRNQKEEKKWMTKISVNVTDSPPAPQIKAPSELRESVPAQVVCSIAYYCPDYPITLTWVCLGHGTPESTTRMDIGRTENTLTFTPTWQDHGTNVTCRLSTPAGTPSSESSVVLDVKYAPKGVQVKATPGETIQEGDRFVLTCITKGSNPPVFTYNWYKDSQLLHQRQEQRLEFEAKGDEHSGSYVCEAVNEISSIRSPTLQIDVHYAPKDVRVELVTGSQIQEETTVVLSCSCRAHPPVSSYTWYRNGQHIPAQTQQELRFDKIHPNQSGSYHCEPQNRVGMSESPAITVDVQCEYWELTPGDRSCLSEQWAQALCRLRQALAMLGALPSFLFPAYNLPAPNTKTHPVLDSFPDPPKEVQITLQNPQHIWEGDAVTLNCSVGSSNPPVTKYTWYKDDSQYQETQESVLTFPATEERSGSYSCEAQNAIGYRQSLPVSVDVQCKSPACHPLCHCLVPPILPAPLGSPCHPYMQTPCYALPPRQIPPPTLPYCQDPTSCAHNTPPLDRPITHPPWRNLTPTHPLPHPFPHPPESDWLFANGCSLLVSLCRRPEGLYEHAWKSQLILLPTKYLDDPTSPTILATGG